MFLLSVISQLTAQSRTLTDSLSVEVYFTRDYCLLDLSYKYDDAEMQSFIDSISNISTDPKLHVKSVFLNGFTSPDGSFRRYRCLSGKRAANLIGLLAEASDEAYRATGGKGRKPSNNTLRDFVSYIPGAEYSVGGGIINTGNLQLNMLYGGRPYGYMYDDFISEFIGCVLTVVYERDVYDLPAVESPELPQVLDQHVTVLERPALPEPSLPSSVQEEMPDDEYALEDEPADDVVEIQVEDAEAQIDDVVDIQVEDDVDIQTEDDIDAQIDDVVDIQVEDVADEFMAQPSEEQQDEVYEESTDEEDEFVRYAPRPAFLPFYWSLRTNMLYDLALVPNIGFEFYLGRGWTLGASYMHAWWSLSASHYYWRIYGGELYARRYFGRRASQKPLTGHHLGIYGQLFTYDFELGGPGQMSKLSYGAGLEYGYTLPIASRLNLDFTIGAGYVAGEYLDYIPMDGCYVWQTSTDRHMIGPTKAEITLVWLFGKDNRNRKGGRR